MLVFDITQAQTFNNLSTWRQNFLEKAMPKSAETFPFFCLGNKKDLEQHRQVKQSDVRDWTKQNNDMDYSETSAMEGTNVE